MSDDEAARRIQSVVRGHQARQHVDDYKQSVREQEAWDAGIESPLAKPKTPTRCVLAWSLSFFSAAGVSVGLSCVYWPFFAFAFAVCVCVYGSVSDVSSINPTD